MRTKVLTSKIQNHLSSILFSVFCMIAAAGITSACSRIFKHFSRSCLLIFVLFIILASCHAADRLYGILCSVFTMLWLKPGCADPCADFPYACADHLADILCAIIITVFISLFTFSLSKRAALVSVAEEQLAEAERESMRANLLRTICHDLRTPLTGIIGSSLTYLEHYGTMTEKEKKDLVRGIYESSTWLIHMAENLLTITRIKEIDLSINTREESVEEVVAEALQRTEMRHKGCEIRVSVPEEFIMIPMDATLIEQVIINLLENALLHSGTDRPIELLVTDHSGFVSFTVRDYGHGIPEHMLNHLFRVTRLNESPGGTKKGSGIGLVLCKTIITAHHGTIVGQNHTNGAEFTFTLPKAKEAEHEP